MCIEAAPCQSLDLPLLSDVHRCWISYIRKFLSLSFNWACALFTLCEILAGFYPFPTRQNFISIAVEGCVGSMNHEYPCYAHLFIAADLHSFSISGLLAFFPFLTPISKVTRSCIFFPTWIHRTGYHHYRSLHSFNSPFTFTELSPYRPLMAKVVVSFPVSQ